MGGPKQALVAADGDPPGRAGYDGAEDRDRPSNRRRPHFRRKQPRVGSAADWQVPIGHDPRTHGVLLFE